MEETMNRHRRLRGAIVVALFAQAAAACGTSESGRRSRGEDLLKAASTKIASAQALSVSVDETTERVAGDGGKEVTHIERQVIVRRPDRLWFRSTGDRDVEGFYDGKQMTLLFHGQKVFGIIPTPATLDDTVQLVSERYDIPLPIGDLLMTNPHQSLISTQTTGGWQAEEDVNGVRSARLEWHHPNVDWTIWIPISGDPLPTRLFVNYKNRRRMLTAFFKAWDLSPSVAEETFHGRIPDDYEGVAVLQRAAAVLSDSKDDPLPAQGSTAPAQ
jgi:hypothetical protein